MTFKTDRPNETYIMFGDGMHSCFGTAIGPMTLGSWVWHCSRTTT